MQMLTTQHFTEVSRSRFSKSTSSTGPSNISGTGNIGKFEVSTSNGIYDVHSILCRRSRTSLDTFATSNTSHLRIPIHNIKPQARSALCICWQLSSKKWLKCCMILYHMTVCQPLIVSTAVCSFFPLPEFYLDYFYSAFKVQDAQLSQRDRAAGCVIVFAKSRTLERADNDLRTL